MTDADHRNEQGYTIEEACQILGVSRPTVVRWLRSGKLPATRVGGRWKVPAEEIEKRLAYSVLRHAPEPILNGPLSEKEVETITSNLAHALRQLGAPIRADGLRKIVLGKIPVDALLWRYLDRALTANTSDHAKLEARIELWGKACETVIRSDSREHDYSQAEDPLPEFPIIFGVARTPFVIPGSVAMDRPKDQKTDQQETGPEHPEDTYK